MAIVLETHHQKNDEYKKLCKKLCDCFIKCITTLENLRIYLIHNCVVTS